MDFNEASEDFDNFLGDVVVERHRLSLRTISSASINNCTRPLKRTKVMDFVKVVIDAVKFLSPEAII